MREKVREAKNITLSFLCIFQRSERCVHWKQQMGIKSERVEEGKVKVCRGSVKGETDDVE